MSVARNPPARPHPLCQPARHRHAAGAHFPTPPPFAEPSVIEVAERPRIEQLGERREPFAGLRAAVVEQVAVHGNQDGPGHLVRVKR